MAIKIEINTLYGEVAKLNYLDQYVSKALGLAGDGQDVVLTGPGPIWLYLCIAHALHGKVRSLSYESPVTGRIRIFDHNPL